MVHLSSWRASSSEERGERIQNIQSPDEVMEIAQTSAYERPGRPKGVVFVVLYASMVNDGHGGALDALKDLSEQVGPASGSTSSETEIKSIPSHDLLPFFPVCLAPGLQLWALLQRVQGRGRHPIGARGDGASRI